MKVTCVAANPFNTICANIHAIWECSQGRAGAGTHLKTLRLFSLRFSLANFRTRTQNQHNFIYLKQYRLAKGSTWRRWCPEAKWQKVWLLNYFNLVGFGGDDNSYKMRAEHAESSSKKKKRKWKRPKRKGCSAAGEGGKKIKEVKRLRQSSVKFILSRHCSYMYVGPRGGGTTGVTVAWL